MTALVHGLPLPRSHNATPLMNELRERRRRRRQRWIAFVFIVGLSLAAFGVPRYVLHAQASAASPASLPATCSLLATKEVASALGHQIAIHQSTFGSPRGCTWQSVRLGRFTSASAGLSLDVAHVSRQAFQHAFNKGRLSGRGILPYNGIGQVAYLQPDGNGSYELSVWQNGVVVQSSAWLVDSPLATEKVLAAIVLRRLLL
jgi:hypothetical protein